MQRSDVHHILTLMDIDKGKTKNFLRTYFETYDQLDKIDVDTDQKS